MPVVNDHTDTKVKRDRLGLPVRMGGLGFIDPVATSSSAYGASIKVTNPLVRWIVEQEHQPSNASEFRTLHLIEHTKTKRRLSKWEAEADEELPSYREGIIKLADRDSTQRAGLQSE